jgi:tol-pal system protein YbgF
MTSTSSANRKRIGMAGRLAAAMLLLFSLALLGPRLAAAQDNQALADQLSRLQRELSDLQAYVYNGNPPPTGSGGTSSGTSGGSNLLASQEVRLQQLESQISELNGKFEDVTYQLSQLSQRFDKLSQDVDFRLTQLEQGGAGAATVGSAEAVGGQAAPAATGETMPGAAPPPSPAGTQILGTLTQSQIDAANQGAAAPAPAGTETAAAAPAGYDLPGSTPQEQYEYAFGLLKQANYGEAELALAEFVRRNPADVLAGNAQYWLGETFYVRGDYTKAAVAFADGYQKYPNSGKAGPNLLKLGMSLGELGKKDDACTALSELLKKFPGADTDLVDQAHREQQRFGCG